MTLPGLGRLSPTLSYPTLLYLTPPSPTLPSPTLPYPTYPILPYAWRDIVVAVVHQEAIIPVEESSAALRQQISRQEFSAEDVERQATERRRVKEAMLNARDAKAKARKVGQGWR